MKVTLQLKGQSALIMHNERLADPLDTFTEALSAVTKKRNKTKADHELMAHIEFLGGLYTDPVVEYPVNGSKVKPGIPSWNILRCLQDGGRRFKRGMDVPRGIYPLQEFVPLQFDGPTDPEKLWQDGGFKLRKSVGVQRSRTMRTRPIFPEWEASLPIEVDAEVFDLHTLRNIWKAAGIYAGLGDMRPIYGRFEGTIAEEKV